MARILVSGATGQVGGAVARTLLRRGHDVTAFVRNPDKPAARAMVEAGASLVVGDLSDPEACRRAVRSQQGVFLLTSPMAGIEEEVAAGRTMAEAAVAEGVQHVVLSSVADAQNDTGIPHFDSKWVIEGVLEELGAPYTAVAPAFFYDNTHFPWNVEALKAGQWRQALPPDRPLKMVAVETIAAFVAYAFEHRHEVLGQHIDIASDELTGPQMAEALGAAPGTPVRYEEQPLDEVRDQFEDMATMYAWFDHTGFSTDVAALRARFPDVPWTPFAEWAKAQAW